MWDLPNKHCGEHKHNSKIDRHLKKQKNDMNKFSSFVAWNWLDRNLLVVVERKHPTAEMKTLTLIVELSPDNCIEDFLKLE